MIGWKVWDFLASPCFFFLFFFPLYTPGVTKYDRRRRDNTGKWRVSVCLSVFTLSNATTVEKGEENWCSDLLLPYCRSCCIGPEDRQGRAEEGKLGGGAEGEWAVNAQVRGGERKGGWQEEEMIFGLSLFSPYTPRYTKAVCVCDGVCVCVCVCVRLASTLSRLCHRVLLLLATISDPI